jgi:4-hydroxythreonine-4-phosphate dehydrogenase
VQCTLSDYRAGEPIERAAGALSVLHIPLAVPAVAGRLDTRNAHQVLAQIDRAVSGCLQREFAAMVTAPVQKSVINDAGVPFSGHTEYIAAKCGAAQALMLLTDGDLKVALATTHLPLRAVADALSVDGLCNVLTILHRELQSLWGIAQPRIAVCGLNPHAGESGHLGHEERDIIEPSLQRARAAGIDVHGPFPADTLLVPRYRAAYDVVLAMYHDQGLPVLKASGFGAAVNVTLGLPIVRTSVDHGTALDLAGSGRAEAGSLLAAIALAVQLAQRRR